MAAYLPKSSTENERTTIAIEATNGQEIVMRQIAGAMAKRIVSYAPVGGKARQNEHAGFIKFGSRVDLYLPLGTKIDVKLGQKVTGSQTLIGTFQEPESKKSYRGFVNHYYYVCSKESKKSNHPRVIRNETQGGKDKYVNGLRFLDGPNY